MSVSAAVQLIDQALQGGGDATQFLLYETAPLVGSYVSDRRSTSASLCARYASFLVSRFTILRTLISPQAFERCIVRGGFNLSLESITRGNEPPLGADTALGHVMRVLVRDAPRDTVRFGLAESLQPLDKPLLSDKDEQEENLARRHRSEDAHVIRHKAAARVPSQVRSLRPTEHAHLSPAVRGISQKVPTT